MNKSMYSDRTSELNHYFDALADQNRRIALYFLKEHETTDIGELARHVAMKNVNQSTTSDVGKEYETLHRTLHHNHLPRLANYGIIDFDSRTGDVQFRTSSHELLALIWISEILEAQQ